MIQATAEMLSARKRNGVWHGLICRNRLVPESTEIKSAGATIEPPKADDSAKPADPAPLKRQLIVERIEPGSPAAEAGFQPGDVLVRVEDTRVACSLDLERALIEHSPGQHLAVLARRGGLDQRFELALRSVEQAAPAASNLAWRKLGVRLKPIDSELVSRMSQQLHGGLAITEVNPQSPADKAGIQRGDILVGLHQLGDADAR